MFRGTVDRAGTREGKKTSLRKTGKDKKQASATNSDDGPKTRTEQPPALKESGRPLSTIDCGANLMNRHLEPDQSRIIQRALQACVDGIVIITNDFEKSEAALAMATANPGVVYAAMGIHPNNISSKKMSDKLFLQLVAQLRTMAVNPHVLAIYCGLDYERDYGLKFPQEKFMKAQIKLASELKLPVVLQDMGGGEGLLEVMKECRTEFERGMIYVFNAGSKMLQRYIDLDFYISFNGTLCETSDKGDQMRDFITQVPRDRLIILTESPAATPASIPDEYVRTMPNEPSNLVWIIQTAAKCLEMTPEELSSLVKENAKRFYGLSTPVVADAAVVEGAVPAAAVTTSTTTSTKGKKKATGKNAKKDASEDEQEEEDEDDDEDEEKVDKDINIISKLAKSELENLFYSCRKCRTKLFKVGDVVEHDEKTKTLDHTMVNKKGAKEAKDPNIKRKSCKSLFMAPEACAWLKQRADKQILCPNAKCQSKLGSFNAAAEQCSCGAVQHSLVRVPKSRVELVLLGEDGELVDLALLHLDETDDSDDEVLKKKKKRQVKKTVVKKNNKGNFSNYRNKDAGVSQKKSSKGQQPLPLEESSEEDSEEDEDEDDDDDGDSDADDTNSDA
eukprot:gene13908-16408_t